MDINGAHEPKRHLFNIDDSSPWVLRSAQGSEDLCVEATLPWLSCQLQRQDPCALDPCPTVK